MQLVTLAARPGAGVILGDEIVDLVGCRVAVTAARLLPPTVRGILEAGVTALELVRRVADEIGASPSLAERLREAGALVKRTDARLLAPITDPALILSCGMNYREHLREMNSPVPDYPTSFAKNANAIVGPGASIVLPAAHPDMVDWEAEFSIVIGCPCHAVAEADALDYAAGYTLINDVSARDWVGPVFQSTAVIAGVLAWERNLLGKQFPTFCPMGPVLTTRDEIRNPDDVHLEARLNGVVMQSANTSDLVFGVRKLIAYYSQWYRFQPGDIITTGSPSPISRTRSVGRLVELTSYIRLALRAISANGTPLLVRDVSFQGEFRGVT